MSKYLSDSVLSMSIRDGGPGLNEEFMHFLCSPSIVPYIFPTTS